jgi:hypothetical protein
VTASHVLSGEAYSIPKNSPVSATAQTTRNLYAVVGTSPYGESSADASPTYPVLSGEETRNLYGHLLEPPSTTGHLWLVELISTYGLCYDSSI